MRTSPASLAGSSSSRGTSRRETCGTAAASSACSRSCARCVDSRAWCQETSRETLKPNDCCTVTTVSTKHPPRAREDRRRTPASASVVLARSSRRRDSAVVSGRPVLSVANRSIALPHHCPVCCPPIRAPATARPASSAQDRSRDRRPPAARDPPAAAARAEGRARSGRSGRTARRARGPARFRRGARGRSRATSLAADDHEAVCRTGNGQRMRSTRSTMVGQTSEVSSWPPRVAPMSASAACCAISVARRRAVYDRSRWRP